MVEPMSLRTARAIAIESLGLAAATDSSVLDTIDRLGLLQIDSVNVFERAHYLPLFSRMGRYDKTQLDDLTGGFNPTLIEYWAHEASIIRTQNLPLYQWRMDAWRDKVARQGDDSWMAKHRDLVQWIKAEIAAKGPLTAKAVEHDRNVRKGNWWGWSDVKEGLEGLFALGELVSGGRDKFSRIYALPEQVLPQEILNQTIAPKDAKRKLITQAATALGVGTKSDILDWHRIKNADAENIIEELVEGGHLVEIAVEGWREPAYAPPKTLNQKTLSTSKTTLISPFDPLVWHRPRTQRLFDFHYRIEIYTPEPKRQFGYYTLPVLHKNRIVGRIDLKNNRQENCLIAKASWHELSLAPKEVSTTSAALARHLALVAKWQNCNRVQIEPKGNWASELRTYFA